MNMHWLMVVSTLAACGDNNTLGQDVVPDKCLLCATDAVCAPTATPPCSCDEGFTGDGTSDGTGCVDIDECAAHTNNCVAGTATCTNGAGGFTCACNAGFTGDGTTTGTGCRDTNECAAHPNNCVPATPLAMIGIAAARPAITTDERQHLVYELLFLNTSETSVQITRIDVRDSGRPAAIASYHGESLAGILAIIPDSGPATGTIAPGGIAFAFFDLDFGRERHLPRSLAHRIEVQQGGSATVFSGPTVPVLDDSFRGLGPPLRGDRLLDLNGCCDGAHSRALFELDNGLFVAQRFAIDFVRVDDQGTFTGDPTNNASYFLFGAEVIATRSGRIVEATDGMAENIPPELPPFDIRSALGNHVVEALNDGRFALYAHLQNGSVRVHAGELVRRGQVLGLVGNTGHSSEPHLHFHIMDRASPLASDGLPYVFDHFRLQATVDLTAGEPTSTPVPPPQQRRDRLPMSGDVIAFP